MSCTTRRMNLFLFIFFLNGVIQIQASKPSGIGQFFTNVGDKISQTAATIKEYLLELFYRFRAFFMGHSESTHQFMTSQGCGYTAEEPAIYNKQSAVIAKIKGGDDAIWHTWPWMVALFTSPRHGWSCAGVLINENTILTAAHCLTHTTASEMKAIIGVHTILGKLNPLNYYSISAIYRHPKFDKCCKYDIAVLKLSKSVLYGPKINSVCLPFAPYTTVDHGQALINRTGIIIGWGDSSQNSVTNMFKSFTLQQADVRIFDNYYCRRTYGSVFDSDTEICAGDYNQRTDTMSGDSGGPLLIRQSDGRWIVLGITSYGAATTPSMAPGVYVKLSAHVKWLESYIKSN
ncbi:unnamed protein product [Rotaria sp. Silwood2]|nr:unnamed protein product [Rotaria sp. Silwood2]CAF3192855.1 unnamed protein product [Rotaria sp. Silwood2]CAF3286095.1 unnamed protein product [Rotaria sp. Silwood2]CAF4221558.1 unnamed protein product [Rotaria sp. Silwood2]CAF4250557.1 unnamed protein product [Rotaria sp. Silwood2]